MRAGLCLGKRVHEVRELEQLDEHLRHVVDEGHELAPREASHVHLGAAHGQHRHEAQVHGGVRERIHEGGDVAYGDLLAPEGADGLVERLALLALAAEGAEHADALELLARGEEHTVEAPLDAPVPAYGHAHDEPDEEEDKRRDEAEEPTFESTYEACGDDGAKDRNGASEHEAEEEVDPILNLVRIVCEPRDECRGAEPVDVCARKTEDVAEQVVSKGRAKARAELCAEVLGRGGTGPADDPHDDEGGGAEHDVPPVCRGDALVHDARHNERHEELKRSLQKLEERGEGAFPSKSRQVPRELEHACLTSWSCGLPSGPRCLPQRGTSFHHTPPVDSRAPPPVVSGAHKSRTPPRTG